MVREQANLKLERRDDLLRAAIEGNHLWIAWCDCDEFEPCLVPDDVWDALELDDETAETLPEPGDFWGEVDEEEEIWAG